MIPENRNNQIFTKRLIKIVIIIHACNGIVFNETKKGDSCKGCKMDNPEYIQMR